jgi:hypothetical protein
MLVGKRFDDAQAAFVIPVQDHDAFPHGFHFAPQIHQQKRPWGRDLSRNNAPGAAARSHWLSMRPAPGLFSAVNVGER